MSPKNSKTKSRKAGRRRGRRRIHPGRLLLVCSVFALAVIALMAAVSRSCTNELGIVRSGGDFRKPIPSAIERANADANRVLKLPAGSMERQGALIEIRATEHRLRNSGHLHAADDYINTATDVLRTHGALSPDTIR